MGQHIITRTLVELLQQRTERHPDKVAFSFSYHGDGENTSQLTYRELDIQAQAIASRLQQLGAAGERVLVLCRPGLDCIAGFFGCVYAGAVAVPVHERLAPRLRSVVPDAQAGFALATPGTQPAVRAAVDLLAAGRPLQWCSTDAAADDGRTWVSPAVGPDTTALVQYTSGSTRSPKGVVLTHGNLLHNLAAIHQAWPGDEHATGLFWLPPHHDMGLIGAVLEILYVGATSVLMSPTAFITRPMRWLEAISRHHATVTVAPNFAYDKCVETSSPDERAALDLSSLSTAMNGAEPVRETTLRAFADAFAPAGFRPEAFLPVYGLAETALLVSGRSDSALPTVAHVDRTALGEDRVADAAPDDATAATLVGCGRPRGGQRVVIVDPETRVPRGPDEVGEIWIAGPSVAQGYWGRPEETEHTFSVFLADTGSDQFRGPFLRTGDLGFLRSGELFVTGRCNGLVVIDGHNYYPNDIETTVQDCHPAFLSGRGAVFAVTPQPGAVEQLVVVQEMDRDRIGEAELIEMATAIQTAVTEHHGIAAHSVILVEPMRIPTTSSGKIQRDQCRQQFLDRKLETLAEWHAPVQPDDARAKKLAGVIKVAGLLKFASALQQRGSGQP
ncbi:fatty acyl-AMP ligase [Mycobacterium sp.]|uniref:fatty acyl-AMP ligase n=1 Tax=Mycobacterium sp. TaxID=1785 RepID=UPI0031D7C5A7